MERVAWVALMCCSLFAFAQQPMKPWLTGHACDENGQPIAGAAVGTVTWSQSVDTAAEDRSRNDGWQIPAFWSSPIAVHGDLYFATTLGLTYALDGRAAVLDEDPLLAVNDLGPTKSTWSMSTPSCADGRLYHRSLREVVCIGTR